MYEAKRRCLAVRDLSFLIFSSLEVRILNMFGTNRVLLCDLRRGSDRCPDLRRGDLVPRICARVIGLKLGFDFEVYQYLPCLYSVTADGDRRSAMMSGRERLMAL